MVYIGAGLGVDGLSEGISFAAETRPRFALRHYNRVTAKDHPAKVMAHV